MPFPLIPAGTKAGGYTIAKSLRFRSSASAYLSRTPGTAGNRRTFTVSFWMKRGALGGPQYLFAAGSGTTEATWFANAIDTATASDQIGSATWTTAGGYTNASLRDPSAWYHIVIAIDTTQATAANRSKLYVNGVLQTYTAAVSLSLNADLAWNNSGVVHYIGARVDSGPRMFFDGYFADIYNIDGQALDPTYFGQTDTATGVWMPKKYTGTYGTNGFYLNFSDASGATATTIGKDSSGNGNNWTPTNISVTAGVTYDSMVDTPTNYDNGGNGAGNYAVLNPLDKGSIITLSAANLTCDYSGTATDACTFSTIAFDAGSTNFYAEFTLTAISLSASDVAAVGITDVNTVNSASISTSGTAVLYLDSGSKVVNGTTTAFGASWTTNDVIGVYVNQGTITFYKNGTSQGNAATGVSGTYKFVIRGRSGVSRTFTVAANFGQRAFSNTPSGAKALCTQNLPTPTIGATSSTLANKYFDVLTWTGNSSSTGTTRNQTGLSFQPDFVWIKNRSNAYFHNLYDAVRGAGSTKNLVSNTTDAEGASNSAGLYGYLSSFNSDGFQTTNGTDASFPGIWVNQNTQTFVSWNWKANGSGSSNTNGTVTSTVSANVTAGFSIVTFTCPASGNFTVGHGLGVAPAMIIVKSRSTAGNNWCVVHKGMTSMAAYFQQLNTTIAQTNNTSIWANTAPTSSVFSMGTNVACSPSDTAVAYCFAEVAGYSKFGSYTGNGSADGPFVYCGFRPRYVMAKASTLANQPWMLFDTSRQTYNSSTNPELYANTSGAEVNSYLELDILSNGFKVKSTGTGMNSSGDTYIYAAFCEQPFNYSRAR